ncbi:MAG TPA: hypothetical protein VHF27_03110 [Acidimicrobiales bacterium]|nr:hypothetical protein [Acidimicrobiales bacterium]
MGEWELGVRSTSAAVHDVLRRALAAHLVDPDDDPASPNFSLHVADDAGERGAKEFHLLHHGTTAVVRTRDLRRLVDGLLGYLSAAVERPDDDTLRLDVLALVRDGAAVLAPAGIRPLLPSVERRLNAKGLRVVDRPWSCVDVTTGELVVPEPELAVDRSALEPLGRGSRHDGAVPPGRYPVVGWAFGAGREAQGPISRALALTFAGGRLLDRRTLDPQAALDRLAAVLGRLHPVGMWVERLEGVVDPLAALACSPKA